MLTPKRYVPECYENYILNIKPFSTYSGITLEQGWASIYIESQLTASGVYYFQAYLDVKETAENEEILLDTFYVRVVNTTPYYDGEKWIYPEQENSGLSILNVDKPLTVQSFDSFGNLTFNLDFGFDFDVYGLFPQGYVPPNGYTPPEYEETEDDEYESETRLKGRHLEAAKVLIQI